jgi:hypothetical protein
MIIDKELQFSDAQAVTADAASTDHIDQVAAGDALHGSELYLVVRVHTTMDSAGEAATLTIKLQSDDNSSFNSAKDHFISEAFAESALVAGTELVKMKLPTGMQRYIRVYYDRGTEDFTAGKVDAFLTPTADVR